MDLLDEIKARCPPEVLALRDTEAIAAAVSEGRVKLAETHVGERTVFRALGMADGAAFLDRLHSLAQGTSPMARTLAYAVKWLEADKLNVADPLTLAQLDALHAAGVLTADQLRTLKALAEQPDPVSEYDVRAAVWSADGRWLAD